MEYVLKHTTENYFCMIWMVKDWWFVMFVMVFIAETIRISVMFYCFFSREDRPSLWVGLSDLGVLFTTHNVSQIWELVLVLKHFVK